MSETGSYLMENPFEAERLELKTDERETRRQLRRVGLARGMSALDAGAGTGAVARVMAKLVGAEGRVAALDRSPERLREGAQLAAAARLANVSFVEGDVLAPPLEPASFDFVWSRFLFAYLEEPDRALARLVELAKPGGKVVVGEVDGQGIFHDPMPAAFAADLARIVAALRGRLDVLAGRKLYGRLRRADLAEVRVQVLPYHLHTDALTPVERRNWEIKLETIRPVGEMALGGAGAYTRFARRFMDHLFDPDALTYSVLFLAEGVRRSPPAVCRPHTLP